MSKRFAEIVLDIKNGESYVCTNKELNIEIIKYNGEALTIIGRNGAVKINNSARFELATQPITIKEAMERVVEGKKVYMTLPDKPDVKMHYNEMRLVDQYGNHICANEIINGIWFAED